MIEDNKMPFVVLYTRVLIHSKLPALQIHGVIPRVA